MRLSCRDYHLEVVELVFYLKELSEQNSPNLSTTKDSDFEVGQVLAGGEVRHGDLVLVRQLLVYVSVLEKDQLVVNRGVEDALKH